MSDRSALQVIVYACPEDQRAALVEALAEYGGEEFPAPGGELTLREPLYAGDDNLDANESLADAIIAAAPGATFSTWVDPKYEYPGAITSYAPDLGRFDGVCDANGNPYITAPEVRRILDAAEALTVDDTEAFDSTRGELRRALGLAWEERFAEIGRADIVEVPAEAVADA